MLVGQVVKVPLTICETGFIRVVSINSPGPHTQPGFKWDYKARFYDPTQPDVKYSVFDVMREEMDAWTSCPKCQHTPCECTISEGGGGGGGGEDES